MNNAIEQYRMLVSKIDSIADTLTNTHADHIVCAERCCACCTNFSVWPVEFHSILDQLRQAGVTSLTFDDNQTCGFLNDSLCKIYQYRPIICRTHGLPIVFLNDDTEPPEHSVSFCDDNFTEINPETFEFNSENTLNIDQLNAELYSINLEFIKEHPDKLLTEDTRIELRQLINYL